jgi:hypothetical protein
MARMTLVLILSVGCAGTAEESEWTEPVHIADTTGAEVEVEVEVAVAEVEVAREQALEQGRGRLVGIRGTGRGGGGVGNGTIGLGETNTIGENRQRTPSPTPEERAASQAQQQIRFASAEARYQTRCGGVTITPGPPPTPPQAPSTPGLQALRPVYEASLAVPLTPPTNNTMAHISEWAQTVFSQWLQSSATRLRALNRAAGTTPESDRQHARVWVAHAQAVFVELFQRTPVPDEIGRDPELRAVYVSALVDQGEPLLRRVVELTDGVVLPGAWARWKAAMQTWLAQESCALH